MEPSDSQRPMPLREICREHHDEWLLVKILDTAAPSGDGLCVLLARAPDRNTLYKASRKARKQHPDAPMEVLHGATKFGDGEALRTAIERLKRQDEWISVNPWWG